MLFWEKHFKIDGEDRHCYMALLCVRGWWELRSGFMGRLNSHSLSESEAFALVGESQAEIARKNSPEMAKYLDGLAVSKNSA